MAQGALPFQYAEDRSSRGITGLAGLAAYLDLWQVAGLGESVSRHMGVNPGRQGWTDALDKRRLGQVVDLVSNIKVGGTEAQATDVLGRVYEYFLEQFALAEGRKGGEFYTPRSVVRLLVEMLEPYQGRVYDPCCGSSGIFVQSVEFIRARSAGRAEGDLREAMGLLLLSVAYWDRRHGRPAGRSTLRRVPRPRATMANRTEGP